MRYSFVTAALLSATLATAAAADSSQTGQVVTTTTTNASGTTTTATTSQSGTAAAQAQAALQGTQITNANSAYTGSGITGTVTPGTGAGTMEGNLLTAVAINSAAEEIKTSVGNQSGNGMLIITGFGSLDLSQAMLYEDRLETIGGTDGELNDAIAHYKSATGTHASSQQIRIHQFEVGLPIRGGILLNQAGKVLSYFMTNYQISGANVPTNDNMLAIAIAAREPDAIISTQMVNYSEGKKILHALEDMMPNVKEATKDIAAGTALLKPKKKPANAADIQKAVDELTQAVADYNAFQLWLLGGVSGTTTTQGSLPAVMQQEAAITLLQHGGTVLFIQIDNAAGGFVTKQNLWTEFGAMPFYAAAGVVVSYALYGNPLPAANSDPAAGKTPSASDPLADLVDPKFRWKFLQGGLFGVATPYRKVGHVPMIVRLDKSGECNATGDKYAPGLALPGKADLPSGRDGTYCPR